MHDALGFAPPEHKPLASPGLESLSESATQPAPAPGDVMTLPAVLLDSHTIISRTLHGEFQCKNGSDLNNLCRVTLFELSDGRQVIVMSELAANAGSSVANSLDFLLPAVHEALGSKSVEDTVFVEHSHSQLSHRGESHLWERFDRVIVEADHNGRPTPQGWHSYLVLSEEHDNA